MAQSRTTFPPRTSIGCDREKSPAVDVRNAFVLTGCSGVAVAAVHYRDVLCPDAFNLWVSADPPLSECQIKYCDGEMAKIGLKELRTILIKSKPAPQNSEAVEAAVNLVRGANELQNDLRLSVRWLH
jgi:hypothetical protein